MLHATARKIEIVNRPEDLQHFGELALVYRLFDVVDVVQNILSACRAKQSRCHLRIRAGKLNRELHNIDPFRLEKLHGFATTLDDGLARRMPSGSSLRREQPHPGGRSVDNAHSFPRQVRQQICQRVVV
jgi:hypothetical protein